MTRNRQSSEVRSNLAQPLKDGALQSGLSPGQLARRAGIDRRSIARFLLGERDLTLRSADRLAVALGLRLGYSAGRRKPTGKDGATAGGK